MKLVLWHHTYIYIYIYDAFLALNTLERKLENYRKVEENKSLRFYWPRTIIVNILVFGVFPSHLPPFLPPQSVSS